MNQLTTGLRAIHPGEILREDVIPATGLTVDEIAWRLGVLPKTLGHILQCKRAVTPRMAARIGEFTETTTESWIRMQQNYDLNHGKSA